MVIDLLGPPNGQVRMEEVAAAKFRLVVSGSEARGRHLIRPPPCHVIELTQLGLKSLGLTGSPTAMNVRSKWVGEPD